MTRSLRLLLSSLAVVALLAVGAGLALAAGAHSSTPPAVASSHGDDGVENSTAAEHEQEPADTGDTSGGDSGPATDNHGSVVSKVARDTPPGPDHGKIVSAVARDNHGADASASAGAAHAGS